MDSGRQSIWMKVTGACLGVALGSPVAYSADLSQPGAIDQEQKIQHEMQQQLRQQLTPAADDVRLLFPKDGADIDYPTESPCFVINQVVRWRHRWHYKGNRVTERLSQAFEH